MKLSPAIIKETRHIAIGVLIGDAIMIAVFALLKRLDYTVFLGTALGTVAVIVNFLLLGIRAQRAMEDPDRARVIIQRSYTFRMLLMVAVLAVGVAAPCFHTVAVVIPFLLQNVTVFVMQLPEMLGGGKKEAGKNK